MCILAHVFLWNFNTSYVTVQPTQWGICSRFDWHFNTSYVTVQRRRIPRGHWFGMISIHLMLRFNSWASVWFCPWKKFQYILCYGSTLQGCTALKRVTGFQYILCYGSTYCDNKTWIHSRISIHLMLRFNVSNKHFAYNRSQISIHLMLRFNIKSDIQRNNSKKFQYILCYGSTSPPSSGLGLVTSFQYILCYGSTNSNA